jgi:amino acid adenylation domain-containing protein
MSSIEEKPAAMTVEQKRALVAKLLREKAGGRRPPPLFAHRMFEERSSSAPGSIALSSGEVSLTYGELDARASGLAARLRSLGVGPEVLVGVCLGRTPDLVVALLAVLKAGGAYVPLDPSFPEARLSFMLEDANVPVLITEQDRRDQLPTGEARVVCVDSPWEWPEGEGETPGPVALSAKNLAYVIYTSGSTGRPKGVQVTHGALANFLRSMKKLTSMGEDDALLAVTTLSFDIAALEIFLPLAVGARVELVPRDVAADATRLVDRLADPAITFLQATPATWRMLLEAGWEGKPGLSMLCGGEALPRPLADRLLGKGKVLWNVYGPTETTIWSSAWQVEAGEGPISVGRPIANTQLYVLDKGFRPAPVGVAGELYIGGAGLARGYLGRPGLTAERFLPDPFGAEAGGRLYRTGDLARWRADGTLECLGRVDHQVKVRGFRIELGEIEATLAGHPEVREAAVSAFEDAGGETSLAAYVVARGDSGPIPAAELRRWLLASLPEYMVPSTYIPLGALPLTPNGKVDRNALPDPRQARRALGGLSFVPPRGPVEEAIAGLWAETLGVARVGAHDNFFELGGHSLMAIQLIVRMKHIFGVEPPLKDFVDEPTVARLARLVEDGLAGDSAPVAPPIARADRDRPLLASFAQQRLWFLDQLDPGQASYNIPTAVRLVGDLDVPALEAAINEIVRRHEVLRTTFSSEAGIPRQVIADDLRLSLGVDDLGHLDPEARQAEAARLIAEEARRPFDLAVGPLIRARLLRLGDREHVILVTMHHIVSDGWSIGVLIREVSALYVAFRAGELSPLPEPTLQYADYSAWQREWLQGDVLQAQLDYWSGRLEGLPTLEIPTDRPRSAASTRGGDERAVLLPKPLLDSTRELARQEGATLFMTLLAAFQVLLQRYSGQDDFAVGSPIAGRTRSELENLIGFFVNTLILRADLAGDPSFRALIGRTREAALGAYTHQDLPFEQLVGVLRPDREAARSPLFQVMFVLQNAPLPALEAPDLTLELLDSASGTAKFDLTLFATEEPEGLRVKMEYSTDLFDAPTVDRMLAHFRILLEGAVDQPDRPIGSLPMLTEEERRRMLVGWNEPEDDDLEGLGDDDLDSLLDDLSSGENADDE